MKHVGSMLTLKQQMEHKSTGVKHAARFHCDVEDVVPWPEAAEPMEPLQMKSMIQLNKGEKRFQIKQIWGNQKGYATQCAERQMLDDEAPQLELQENDRTGS